jgi:hypothetical protein
MFESKAQADEKAQHTFKYVSILKRSATQLSDIRWGFETTSIWISEINTVRQTDVIGAGRDQSVIDPMMAQVALLSDTFMMVKVNGVVRACFNTRLTAGAQIIIHDHDTIGSFADGFLWAGFDTGRIIAVPALIDPVNEIEQPVDHIGAVF